MSLSNYVAYQDLQTGEPRIGHYDIAARSIQPLSFTCGTPIQTLYQVIEAGPSHIISSGTVPLRAPSLKLLPPLAARDVLCVGKNYLSHAREFNRSGFDSSDKDDRPSHPVIFTKRWTSIIADGEEIYPHPEFTQTLDYEGEVGVVIGKAGYRIAEEEAMEYVWGYTIVNDVTARERQRDHKQFYLGKSADTFCPMGPIAVPTSQLDKVLRVQTYVNGELRQDATTEDLIFSIPYLIKTMSEGQTLMPGDVLATGTPAGVGIGRSPPVYLQPGDTISVSVTGLGTLTNRIASPSKPNPTLHRLLQETSLTFTNTAKTTNPSTLITLNNKPLYYRALGPYSAPPVVFAHGLGATTEFFTPLISALNLNTTHTCHLFDLEGHGLSPTHPLSTLSIPSFAADLTAVFSHAGISSNATLIAHSMGCLIALAFVAANPDKVSRLILLGPPPAPLTPDARKATYAHATTVRRLGMVGVVEETATGGTSVRTRSENSLAVAAGRMMLLGQDPEGYAKGCMALLGVEAVEGSGRITARTLIVTGSEDRVSTVEVCRGYAEKIEGARVEVLEEVGHWHVLEDLQGVSEKVAIFLK